jgi:histidinol-phosphatase (PHP family)
LKQIPWSFHTHSRFCDGEGHLEDFVRAALQASVTDLGFSSHAPLPFETGWNMPLDRLSEYVGEVRRLQSAYRDGINLYLGAELDYIPLQTVTSFQQKEISSVGFDYFVGSVHFLGGGDPPASFDGTEQEFARILRDWYGSDIREMTADYYRRIGRVGNIAGVKIVGHFDVIKRWNAGGTYFRGDESWYLSQVESALDELTDSGVAVELNTAGWRKGLGEPYPSPRILELCQERGMPITASSDAHSPDQVNWGYDRALDLLRSLQIEPINPASLINS